MPLIEELKRGQIPWSLDEAVTRSTPVIVTCCVEGRWHNLRSRFLTRTPEALWLEHPTCAGDDEVDVTVGLQLGFSFKLKHHKHIFNLPVQAVGEYTTGEGRTLRAVRVDVPGRMHRVQRRAYQRAEVPRNRSALATLWLGGHENARPDDGQNRPTWEGWVTNISAGGFQVRLAHHGAPEMDLGDLVGVTIALGQEFGPITVSAQFRQTHVDERGITYNGFQFVGLNESPQGRKMLHSISRVVCEFQRHGGRRRSA